MPKAGDASRAAGRLLSPEDGASALDLDNVFWRFSLAVYASDGVARECLALQEALKADVNLLLFCAWMGARNVALSRRFCTLMRGQSSRPRQAPSPAR
jgi:uncharacterized protein (TIGR02444 family)